MRPRSLKGMSTARRVPNTTCAVPDCASSHERARSPAAKWLCAALTRAPGKLAQSWRQARGDHLSQRSLVIRGAELEELDVFRTERWDVVDNAFKVPKPARGYRARIGQLHHDADLSGPSEGHDDERTHGDAD